MNSYITVQEAAEKWNLSPRSIRNYCQTGRIPGAFRMGNTWLIPSDASRPLRKKRTAAARKELLPVLQREMEQKTPGGIYHRIQVDLTYNSNHIEGSRLSQDQTRLIFETRTIGISENINIDDIIETSNHFRCIDLIIQQASRKLSESLIRQLHFILKSSTSDAAKPWFAVGEYKKMENFVGNRRTTPVDQVSAAMKKLLADYNAKPEKSLQDLVRFHAEFEKIHPFQDGNGRIGRLILFKECLHYEIMPFIITEDLKFYYYRGLDQWDTEKGYLMDTCLSAQDRFKKVLDAFDIPYSD